MALRPKIDAVKRATEALEAHARDPRARMFRLDVALVAVSEALAELELRQGQLATVLLATLEDSLLAERVRLHPAQLQALAVMSDHAAAIARRIAPLVTNEACSHG